MISMHDSEYSRAIVKAFRMALEPLMSEIAPDWFLHHIELERHRQRDDWIEEAEVRLIIRRIGSAREVNDPLSPKSLPYPD